MVSLAWISRQGPLQPLTLVRSKPLHRFSSASTGAHGGSLLGLAWPMLLILDLGTRWAMSGLPVESIDEQRFFWTRLSPDLNHNFAQTCHLARLISTGVIS